MRPSPPLLMETLGQQLAIGRAYPWRRSRRRRLCDRTTVAFTPSPRPLPFRSRRRRPRKPPRNEHFLRKLLLIHSLHHLSFPLFIICLLFSLSDGLRYPQIQFNVNTPSDQYNIICGSWVVASECNFFREFRNGFIEIAMDINPHVKWLSGKKRC